MGRGPKIELWHADNDRWYFHKKATNGRIVESSQGYKEKRYAVVAAKREHPNLLIEEVIRYGEA